MTRPMSPGVAKGEESSVPDALSLRVRRNVTVGLVLALILFFAGISTPSQGNRVRWVDDGDTVVLFNGSRVRYIGVDAPEVSHNDLPAEPFALEAKAFNHRAVYDKKIRLELDRERADQYGRLLAYVFLGDGTFVNAELVRTGHAVCLFRKPNTKYHDLFLRFQRQAMADKVGLWKAFRNDRRAFVGNRNSKRFHLPTCRFGNSIATKNRKSFADKYRAFWEGYSPCKRCNP